MATLPFTIPDEDVLIDTGSLRGLTLEEFLALPEVKPALEYEDGRITQKVPPQGPHSVLQYALCALFNEVGGARKVAFAFPELRATYHRRSYVPDVAVYRWERIPRTPEGEVAQRFTEPPDIAVEIVSPEQSVANLTRKCTWYVGNGVHVALLVHPGDRAVILFRPGQAPATLGGTHVVDLSDIIPGQQFTVEMLFASLRLG